MTWLLRQHVRLDDRKDAPLPQWAIDVLSVEAISYRVRLKILSAHHWDITGEFIPHVLKKPDLRVTPPLSPPQWLDDIRERQKQIAKEYIERKYHDGNEHETEAETKTKEKKKMSEANTQYQQFEFVGYVYKLTNSKWGTEVRLRTLADETNEKWPQHVLVTVGAKKVDRLGDANVGDKVKVTLIPTLAEGVSDKTNRAYAINKLNLQSCTIIERASAQPQAEDGDPDDMPF